MASGELMIETVVSNRTSSQRTGAALLLCLAVMAITSIMVLGLLKGVMVEMAAVRNAEAYERAMYLAGAGVQNAWSELEKDGSFRGDIGPISLPPGGFDAYEASVTDGPGGSVRITATGTTNGTTRRISSLVQVGG